MLFIYEAREVVTNIETYGSILLSEPILFTDNLFETITRFCWFLIPLAILLGVIKEKDLFLKLIYFMGSIPLFLTTPVINKLGFKSLYVIKLLIMFAVLMCLIKYLINTMELYKKALNQMKNKDNQSFEMDRS